MGIRTRPLIPIVRDLAFGDYLLRDQRKLSPEDFVATANSYEIHLQTALLTLRSGTSICAHDSSELDRYYQAMIDSGLPIQEFLDTHDFEVSDDTAFDPQLATLTFGVYSSYRSPLKITGLLNIYNIHIEEDSTEVLEISGLPCPAYTTMRGAIHPEDNFQILNHILENDLIFEEAPNRKLDLVAWRLPTRDTHAWVEPGGEALAPLRRMGIRNHAIVFDTNRKGNRVPQNVRRQGR